MSVKRFADRTSLNAQIAVEIRVLCARKGLSQTELARRIGVPQPTFSRRMRGDVAFDTFDLQAIAAALEVKVSDLLPQLDSNQQPAG